MTLLCFVGHSVSSGQGYLDSRGSGFGYFGSVCVICWFAMGAVVGFSGLRKMFAGRWHPFCSTE